LVEKREVKNIYASFLLQKEKKDDIFSHPSAQDSFHCYNEKLAEENMSQSQKLISAKEGRS
jgi:hypothetical protein